MKYLFILILLMIADYDFEQINKIKISTEKIYADNISNIYTVEGMTITKYNSDGKYLCEYSNSYLGEISYVDVSDPMRILLYYKEFNHIQFLDKDLADISDPVSLDDLDISQSEIACNSQLGGFWVFDRQTTQIYRIEDSYNIAQSSLGVNTIFNEIVEPNLMIEKNNYLYVNFPGKGLVVFDKFGSFYSKVPLFNFSSFQIRNNTVIFFENKYLFEYDIALKKITTITLPDTMGVVDAKILQDRLFLLKSDCIKVYKH